MDHTHTEEYFNDFEQKQSLLPYRLSQSGPGISWADLNDDGFDELIIGSGKGGSVSVFENNNGNTFVEKTISQQAGSQNDVNSVLALNQQDKSTVLMAPFNYETSTDSILVNMAKMTGSVDTEIDASILLNRKEALGPMASADYDKDGDLGPLHRRKIYPLKYPASCLFMASFE
ncbi:MAG: FG-GAP repeat protein [Balneolaceae bacterium]|nr:FG-GAP repeat protein [Balneolaceae bacterium]